MTHFKRPNILYLHTHDAGRFIQPHGYAIPTPNLMRLARESLLLRNMHCAAPVCTASRIAMLTGKAAHSVGVLGLAHRGWPLADPSQHLVNHLAAEGYVTALSGIQHEHEDAMALGYQRILDYEDHGDQDGSIEASAARFIRGVDHTSQPFFLSVGFATTHRTFPEPLPEDDEDYTMPPPTLPDNAVTRRDMACYKRAAAILDQQMGRVLQALNDSGLYENTLVICTTDHGLAFPHMKCNLNDHGTGVFCMLRWPERIPRGKVSDALLSHVDIYPTICEWLGLDPPEGLQGTSIQPIVDDPSVEVNDEIFSEVTYHAATEIMRAVRTKRWLYIKRWDPRLKPVGPNIDVSYSKNYVVKRGFPEIQYAAQELYDCTFDPQQRCNVAADPRHADLLAEMDGRLSAWMERTNDPLCAGVAELPPNPMGMDVDVFTGNVGGAPLPLLPEHLIDPLE